MSTTNQKSELSSVIDTLDLDNIDRPIDDNIKSNNSEIKDNNKSEQELEAEKKKKEEEEKKRLEEEVNKQQSNSNNSSNNDDEDAPAILGIAKKLGVFEDKEIDDLGLEDSEEGIFKLVSSAVEKQKESIVEEAFSIHPDLVELRDYVANGGSPEDFYKAKSENIIYSSIVLKEEDAAMQKSVYAEYLKTKGYSKEEIEEEVKEADDTGLLFKKASRGLETLKVLKKQEEEELSANLEKEKQEQELAAKKMWEEIETTVNKAATLKGIPLAPAAKKELLDYVRIGKEGVSRYNEDLKNLKPDEVMAIAYLVKNKLDFSTVFKSLIKTESSNTVKNILQKNNSSQKKGSATVQFDIENLDV